MSSTQESGDLSDIGLGFLIGGIGLLLIIIIVLINVCIFKCHHRGKSRKYKQDEEKMVNMQTERTLNGQNVTQVIVRTQPNGNMDKHNQNNHPYQTMDTETNTVRYETAANQSMQQETPATMVVEPVTPTQPAPEPVIVDFHGTNGSTTKIITSEADEDDVDSGTGTSPTRAAVAEAAVVEPAAVEAAAVDVHDASNVEENAHDNPTFDNQDESPYASYSMPPPPPESMPPPLTPGTPVTDLDAEETLVVPPPPPLPSEDVYAQINKNRTETEEPGPSVSHRDQNLMKSVYRPGSEIEIIEKSKF